MRACHVALLVTSTSIAAADAPPKPATVVPTRAIPRCAPSGAQAAHDTDPLVWWDHVVQVEFDGSLRQSSETYLPSCTP